MPQRLTARAAVPLGALLLVMTAASDTGHTDEACRTAMARHADDTCSPRKTGRPPHPAEIAALFHQWNAALTTGDARRVADRYASDAVLVPTLSATLRTDRAGIVDYFTEFLRKRPLGTRLRSVVTVLDDDSAI